MGTINIHNYESFYLDLLDGTISDKDKEKLFAFLDARPDLKVDLEEFEFVRLDAEIRVPFDSSALLQTINRQNAEDYIINDIEKQLDADDKQELGQLLQKHDDLQTLYRRYQKTILPAEDIIYPDKDSLKKGGRSLIYYLPLIGAAAAVLFFVLIYKDDEKSAGREIASSVELSNSIDDAFRAEQLPNEENKDTLVEHQETWVVDVNPPASEKRELAGLCDVKKQSDTKETVGKLDPLSSKQRLVVLPGVITDSAANQQVLELAQGDGTVRVNDEMAGFKVDTLVQEEMSKQKLVASEAQTVTEWVRSQLREKLFRSRPERTGKIQPDEVISSVTAAIDRNTGDSFALDYSADDNSKTYTVSFGRFSFTRIKSKK